MVPTPKKQRACCTRFASDCDLVFKDPAPQVFFAGFGDSSWNFELRVFCDGADGLLPARRARRRPEGGGGYGAPP
ncbi:MAG: hypothetical protein ACREVK_13445 [Gammaproteobacteria bacterium]